MKKSFLFIALAFSLFWTTFSQASEDQGVRVKVELITGTTQYAQFLGISQDTVNLGGNIQGNFTIVRIPKNRFKSIVDEQGKDYLTAADSIPNDSIVTDSLPQEPAASTPSFLETVANKHIFVALEHRSIDSLLALQITPVIIKLLQEKGVPLTFAQRTDFGYCRNAQCIKDSLALYGASSVYQGSLTAAYAQDSLKLQLTYTDLKADTSSNSQDSIIKSRTSTISLSVFKPLIDAVDNNKLSHFIKELLGEPIPKKEKGPSYVKMESDPEGAIITIPGRDDVCRTPCTFALGDTTKTEVYAYWNVGGQLWGVKKSVTPIPNDTTMLSVKLKKVKPEIRIYTIPENAYIYAGSAPLTPSTKPLGKSPNTFPIYDPGTSFIQIRKEGFRDTLVTFYASPTEITDITVNLTPLNNPIELEAQKEWVKARQKNFIGKVLMGSSIAPIIAGGLLTLLAYQDYDDAQKIKDELKTPAAAGGTNFQAKVDKNHDLVEKGDRKIIIGGSLLGCGVLMFGAGILLSF